MAKESVYKVGDKVKILSKYPAGLNHHNFPFFFDQKMLDTCGGKVATITGVLEGSVGVYNNCDSWWIDPALLDGYRYTLDIDDGHWTWSTPMFEQQFSLKAGMLVEYQSGDRQIVCPDSKGVLRGIDVKYRLTGLKTSNIVSYFARNEAAFDRIVKIGWPTGSDIENLQFDEILWEYKKSEPTVHEVTLQDIANKFNVPVEQIRIKD